MEGGEKKHTLKGTAKAVSLAQKLSPKAQRKKNKVDPNIAQFKVCIHKDIIILLISIVETSFGFTYSPELGPLVTMNHEIWFVRWVGTYCVGRNPNIRIIKAKCSMIYI